LQAKREGQPLFSSRLYRDLNFGEFINRQQFAQGFSRVEVCRAFLEIGRPTALTISNSLVATSSLHQVSIELV
jgi:hypothetical protein